MKYTGPKHVVTELRVKDQQSGQYLLVILVAKYGTFESQKHSATAAAKPHRTLR